MIASPDRRRCRRAIVRLIATPAVALALTSAALAQTAAPPPAPEGEFDLSSLVQEDVAAAGEGSPLRISGFADFSYRGWFHDEDSVWTGVGLLPYGAYSVGNLNVYLTKDISQRCRMLAEVRFLYEPNGELGDDGQRVDTTVGDHAANSRPIQWGGVRIERVQADCDLTSWLTVRLGQWFTPYGIWNVDHGSPTIIAVRRPYILGEELLPEQQTGIQLFGSRARGDVKLGYYLTLSNGRGPVASISDLDSNKAVGARLELGYGGLGNLTLGGSYYRGRYTALQPTRVDFTTFKGVVLPSRQYDEQSFALDVSWDWRGLAVRSEYLYNERRYTAAGRATIQGLLLADGVRQGEYVLLGYRTPWLGIMPYTYIQHLHTLDAPDSLFGSVSAVSGGVNVLLSPALVLKAEVFDARFTGLPFPDMDRLSGFEAQISWAF
jgi:hypothetical protein